MFFVKKLAYGVMCFATMSASATVTTNLDSYVEYIQSSGTQWIDTGVIGKSTVNMAADVMVLSSAGSSCLIGERPDTGSKIKQRLGIWINNSYKWALNCGTIDTSWIGSISYQNSRCVVSNENGRLWVAVNGGTPTKIHNGADQSFTSSLTLTMFFLNTTAGLDQGDTRLISARVYGLTLHDSGTLVRDFHPCRVTITDTDAGTSVTKYGLWDEINDRFYGDRSGGTDFTAGSDVATVKLVVLPIPDQTSENFGVCRPDCVVSNQYGGAAWIVGSDIASPLFDVEYTENEGAGVATVMVTGKGEYAGEQASQSFNIVATKQEDENILSSDPTARRRIVDGKYVYIFKDPSSAKTAIVKRNLAMTDYLVVGGGGGGGNAMGGGGGGGGVINATGIVRALLSEGDTFTVSVGAGGAGASGYTSRGANGKATSFTFGDISVSVAGGGGGGSWFNTGGADGASGGGGTKGGAGGAGIDGLGYAGATGVDSRAGGGGGGAGHAGYQYTDDPARAGNGGEGIVSSITGEAVYYGGGGSGGADSCDPGFGGLGGGGDGKKKAAGQSGTDGFGGGGGGGSWLGSNSDSRNCGGNGGSGTVILALRPGDFNIEPIADQYLDVGASECTPEPIVRTSDGVTLLTKDVDYTVSYTGNTQSGYAYLTVTGINYYSGKVCEISFKIYRRYFVDDDAEQEGDGSEAAPFATISNAVEKAKTDISGGVMLVEVYVAAGTYTETGLVLDGPIAVVGVDRDNVIVNDATKGKRAFNLSHAEARVSNLTISGSGYSSDGGYGGHVYMTAGAIVDCVVSGGSVGRNASQGGNVWMSGGKLVRCQILNGRLSQSLPGGNTGFGAGVYASGGVVDSCLVKGNTCYNKTAGAGITADGTAKVVNCTISGNVPSTYSSGTYNYSAGICVNGASATVVNCVIYGNGDNSALANFGTANLGRFFYCGSAVTNESCATWTVLTDNDFAEFAAGNLRPIVCSKLVDFGTTGEVYLQTVDCSSLDLDGNARVAGSAIDIGCYELDQSAFAYAGFVSSYAVLEGSNVTFNASAVGPASDIVFRWDYGNGIVENTQDAVHVYVYPDAGLFTVRLSASPDGGTSWGEWYTVPTLVVVAPEVMYVDSNCATPTFPFKTKTTASTTLTAALAALTNNVSGNVMCIDGVEVRILAGSSLTETDMRLASAVSVVGDSGNPGDVTIVDSVSGKRAFLITHPQARVANLTISGTGYGTGGAPDGGQGGHISLSAGTVENCIISGGGVNRGAKGGNVYMTGGRLVRCQILEGNLSKKYAGSPDSFGAGVYASGGVVDSCLIKNNICYNKSTGAGICAEGTAKVVNCTLAGNTASSYSNGAYNYSAGIYVNSANAMVVNCVIYGNDDNSANANFGTSNLNRFFYCGSSVTNASCATWTVLSDADFVSVVNGNWHQKRRSQLIGRGTLDTAYRPADRVTLDLDGNPRVLNRTIDLGCWEVESNLGFCIIVR